MAQNSDIVVFHNDLNKLNMGDFSELEQNLLMGILVACKNQDVKELFLSKADLLSFVKSAKIGNSELESIILNLKEKFFKLNFTIIYKSEKYIHNETYNLFSKMRINYKDNKDLKFKNLSFQEKLKSPVYEFESLELKVNPDFAFLLNQLTKNFTKFELEEFIFLKSKYAKTLYRLLKQYRQSGVAVFDYADFKDKMGITEGYLQHSILRQIIKPTIKILKSEIKTNLFDARVPFKNLKYEFLKADSNGKRGARPIEKIKFTFDIDSIESNNENETIKTIESKSNEIQANPQKVKEIIKTAYSKNLKNNIKSDEKNIAFAKSYIDRKINLYNPKLNVWSVIRLKSINFNNLHDIISYYEDIDTLKEVVLKHTSLDYLNNFLAKNAI